MSRRTPLPLAFLLALVCIATTVAILAQVEEPLPPSLQHGHIATHLTTSTHAFLAVQLPNIPTIPEPVDYEQWIDYLVAEGYVYRNGAVIARAVYTSDATPEGWLLLKLSKPCAPGETETDVGLVTVCPSDAGSGGVVAGCINPTRGIIPLFNGVPPELVPCPKGKRRAVRK